MPEFASAAMVRLLSAAMREQGLAVPPLAAGQAHVSLDAKREVVGAAVAQQGLACLVGLGRGIHHIEGDATYQALAGARDPVDLLARWARLERYVHSGHRVRVLQVGPAHLVLRHEARAGGASPLAAESLVVLGVLVAAMELIGVTGLAVRAGGVDVHPPGRADALEAALERLGHWDLGWRACRPRVDGPPVPADGVPADLCDPLPWPALAHALARRLLADLSAPWTLAKAARVAGRAPRTLQVALQAAGLSYSAVVAEARTRAAAWWLAHTGRSVAEVGFLCGFADQPHFTREFSRRVGVPPARYRQAFASA